MPLELGLVARLARDDVDEAAGRVAPEITPSTHLTGGIRYTIDRRRFAGTTRPILGGGVLGPIIAAASSGAANSR